MPIEFCLPTSGKAVPSGADWLHEVKYDGYRMTVIRDGDRVRLLTKGGHDWSSRYPFIVETALRLREKHFVNDPSLDRPQAIRRLVELCQDVADKELPGKIMYWALLL